MKHPLALKAYVVLVVSFDMLAFISEVVYLLTTPVPVPYPFYTFWSILTLVITYGVLYNVLWYGLWIGNRVAYMIAWLIEVLPWLIGIQSFLPEFLLALPLSFSVIEGAIEWILLALSWKHFFKRG